MRILLAGLALLSTAALPTSTVDGVWRTDGYGQLIHVSGGKLTTYDVTKVSCLPGLLSGAGDGTTFATNQGSVVTIRPGTMTFDDNLGARSLHRVPGGLPRECQHPAELSTFDVFWHTFAENYPFFRAKGVDWMSEGDAARREVAAHPDRLYEVLCGLIRPLHDAHVALSAAGQHCASPRPGTPDPGKTIPRAIAVTDANLGAPTRTWANGALTYADLPGGLGYLRITGFHDYADTFAESSKILAKALDEIFTAGRTQALLGLILDLRANGGGDDPLGLQVAARLTDVPHFAYAKRARNDPDDPARFTVPQPFFVQPARAPHFTGPLTVLTGDLDVSAGETFPAGAAEPPSATSPDRTVHPGRFLGHFGPGAADAGLDPVTPERGVSRSARSHLRRHRDRPRHRDPRVRPGRPRRTRSGTRCRAADAGSLIGRGGVH